MKHDKTKIKPGGETFNSGFMDQNFEKLIFDYLVKKLLALYGIKLFITTVRSALSYDRSVGRNRHVLFRKSSTLILFSHLGLPNSFFLSDDSLKFCVCFNTFCKDVSNTG